MSTLTPTLSRQREREISLFSSFAGSEAAMGNWLVIQTYFDVARAKHQAPKTKRAGVKPFYFPPAYFPQRDAGEKG